MVVVGRAPPPRLDESLRLVLAPGVAGRVLVRIDRSRRGPRGELSFRFDAAAGTFHEE